MRDFRIEHADAATTDVLLTAQAELGLDGLPATYLSGSINHTFIQENNQGTPVAVVKIPRANGFVDTGPLLRREVAVVNALQSLGPLGAEVSEVIFSAAECEQPWAAFSFIPGHVLPREEPIGLPVAERVAFGAKIGEFVAKLGIAFDLSAFSKKVDEPFGACGLDRETMVQQGVKLAEALRDKGYRLYAERLAVVAKEYNASRERGTFATNIVGHDDLVSANCAFTYVGGACELGVFDFALAKPSNAARELRFTPALGTGAVQAACQAYEQITGVGVDQNAIHLWDKMSTLAPFASALVRGYPPSAFVLNDLKRTYPDIDWNEEFARGEQPSSV